MTTLTEVVKHPVIRQKYGVLAQARGAGGLAADSQPGHDRRQRFAGRALLVLPRGLALLSRRRKHLLRRHSRGPKSRACDSPRGAMRGRESVGLGPSLDCAGRQVRGSDSERRAR